MAERVIDCVAGDGTPVVVVIRLARPDRDPEPGGAWRCRLELTVGDTAKIRDRAFGEDSFQALLLALELVPVMVALVLRTYGLSAMDELHLLPRRL